MAVFPLSHLGFLMREIPVSIIDDGPGFLSGPKAFQICYNQVNRKIPRIASCDLTSPTCAIYVAVEFVEEGCYFILRNAKIDMYKGSMRLTITQWGKIERTEDQGFEPKVLPESPNVCLPV